MALPKEFANIEIIAASNDPVGRAQLAYAQDRVIGLIGLLVLGSTTITLFGWLMLPAFRIALGQGNYIPVPPKFWALNVGIASCWVSMVLLWSWLRSPSEDTAVLKRCCKGLAIATIVGAINWKLSSQRVDDSSPLLPEILGIQGPVVTIAPLVGLIACIVLSLKVTDRMRVWNAKSNS